MKGFLVTTDGTAGSVDFENTLEAIYDLLNVELIDIVPVADGIVAIVDDEGVLKDNPTPTVYWPKTKRVLVGNVLFAGDTGRDIRDLDAAESQYIGMRVRTRMADGNPIVVMDGGRVR